MITALLFSALSVTRSLAAQSLDDWMQFQQAKSLEFILPNLSPSDAAPGVVVAASSRSHPDYYFHWVRDSGIVVSAAVMEFDRLSQSENKSRLARFLLDYVSFSRGNQLTKTLSGMGEPKFYIDGKAFDGPWGRPQNDGPALRAISLIQLANVWLKAGKEDWVRNRLYDSKIPTHTVLKADLEFTAHHWRETCFDLWEEVKGVHFYSRMSQRRALIDGAWLADRLNDGSAATFYRQQADLIEAELHRHWDAAKGVLVPTLNRDGGLDYKHSGIDSSVVIAALHGRTNDGFYSVTDDKMLSTFEKNVASFRDIYSINKKGQMPGAAIGRYPEDRYDGGSQEDHVLKNEGNPWFLLTTGFGEFLLRSAKEFERKGSFNINSINAAFFRYIDVDSSASVSDLAEALRKKADTFFARVKYHATSDGRLPEQFNRHIGYGQGARDLTWSYAAFLSAAAAR